MNSRKALAFVVVGVFAYLSGRFASGSWSWKPARHARKSNGMSQAQRTQPSPLAGRWDLVSFDSDGEEMNGAMGAMAADDAAFRLRVVVGDKEIRLGGRCQKASVGYTFQVTEGADKGRAFPGNLQFREGNRRVRMTLYAPERTVVLLWQKTQSAPAATSERQPPTDQPHPHR